MVIIDYFKDVTTKEFTTNEYHDVSQFLISLNLTRHEYVNLRFFRRDIFGEEIDTSNPDFLSINEGYITVINSETIPNGEALPFVYVFIASLAVSYYLTKSLIKSPDISKLNNVTSSKGAGSLSSTVNTAPDLGSRIDDLFGTVNRHTPKLWQLPYRVGVNNQEVEYQLLCISRGRVQLASDRAFRDGDTPYINIPGAAANFYEPNTWPGNGSPYKVIGELIDDRPIGVYKSVGSLNATELLPPNDLTLGAGASWSISGDGSNGTFVLTNVTVLGVTLEDYFTVGQELNLLECFILNSGSTVTLYRTGSETDFTELYNISGNYTVTSVSENTVVVSGFTFTASVQPLQSPVNTVNLLSDDSFLFYTESSAISSYTWYTDESLTNEVYVSLSEDKLRDIGQVFDNVVGPYNIESGIEKVIVNLTSSNGFYDINNTTYISLHATVRIVIEELDSNNTPTGVITPVVVDYDTNVDKRTLSVYQTFELDIPYSNSRIYMSRTSNRNKSEGVTNIDSIEWSYLYTFQSPPVDMDLGDVTLVHCRTPSNSQSRLTKERKTNGDFTRLITQYLGNGALGPSESYVTDDALQIAIHTALDQRNGRLSLRDINADSWLLIRQQIIDYFGDETFIKFGFVFQDNQVSYDDVFITICDAINCWPYLQNSKYDMFFESEQETSSIQITHRNKILDSETREDDFENTYDGVELTYYDNELSEEVTIYVPEDRSAISPESKTLDGCTTYVQALCRANRMYNKQFYEKVTVTFDVDEMGQMIVPGKRIDSPDSTRYVSRKNSETGYRIYDGEVVEINGFSVELSQPVVFTEGEDHYIQFTNLDGGNSELILCTQTEDEFTVMLSSLPSEALYDGYSRDRSKFTFCSEQVRESIALIPVTIEDSVNEDSIRMSTVNCKNYDKRNYKDDPRGS